MFSLRNKVFELSSKLNLSGALLEVEESSDMVV